MTVKDRLTPSISLGNILTIIAMLIGGLSLYFATDFRSQANAAAIRDVQQSVSEIEAHVADQVRGIDLRVRTLETGAARNDERLTNIIGLLNRIDTRLERIESTRSAP